MRVVTWNLNRVEPGTEAFQNVVDYLVRSLAHAHVIALQLVSREAAQSLVAAMGWPDDAFRLSIPDAATDRFGNAVLTAHRIMAAEEHLLPSPSNLPKRSVLSVDVELLASGASDCPSEESASVVMRVCSVHLENTSEVVRAAQAREVASHLDKGTRCHHVLCGDTNSLLVKDYSHDAWRKLCEVASQRGWEPREETVMRFLLGEAGYIDAFDNQIEAMMHGAVHEGTAAAVTRDPRFTFFLPPAEAWIRIDYVLLSKDFPGHAQSCCCDFVPEASNHHPVAAELVISK